MNKKLLNCRICLESIKEQFSIYENVKGKYLPHIIEEISGVVISTSNEPFASICHNCSDDILQAEATIQKCRESNKILLEQQQTKCLLKSEEKHVLEDANNVKNIYNAQIEIEEEINQKETEIEVLTADDNDHEDLLETSSSYSCKVATNTTISKRKLRSNQSQTEITESQPFKCTRRQVRRCTVTSSSTMVKSNTESRKYIRKINVNKDYFFECEYCKFTSNFATYFREHMQKEHNIENPRIFKCQQCPQTFLEYRYLQQHIAYIHEQQPKRKKFLCSECGQGFNKSNHLYYHQRSHLPKEQRPAAPHVKCEHCNKEFSKLSIRMHIKNVHSVERPFTCKLCRSSFALAKGLQAHMKVCHPTELFICPCCEVRFRVRNVYETHVQRGTCQKLGNNCDYCAWGFKTQDRLEKHKLQVHKDMLLADNASNIASGTL